MSASSISMDFVDQTRGTELLEKLSAQRTNGQFCDVLIYVQGEKFQAHRNVLAACSQYFNSILKMRNVVKEELTVACQNQEAFHLLLNFMYTGTVSISKNNVTELLRLANHFLVTNLKNYCIEYLNKNMDTSICLIAREMAEKYDIPDLLQVTSAFIESHISDIISTEQFFLCSSEKLEHFLNDKKLYFQSSYILKIISQWVYFNIAERLCKLQKLLASVDWKNMEVMVIEEHLSSEQLYTDRISLYLFLNKLSEYGIELPSYVLEHENLKSNYALININKQDDVSDEDPKNFCENIGSMSPIEDKFGSENGADKNMKLYLKSKFAKSSEHIMHHVQKKRMYSEEIEIGISKGSKKISQNISMLPTQPEEMDDVSSQYSHSNSDSPYREESDVSDSFPYFDDDMQMANRKVNIKCSHCSYEAYSHSRLEQHIFLVHSNDKTYKCKICKFTCKWNREYYTHMKTHFQGPPFKCDNCSYSSERIQFLLSHRMRHTDEKPFKCKFCDQRCRTKTNLDSHTRCHTGEKPYICELCGRRFTTKASLDQHVPIHSDSKPYLCDSCGFSTKHRSHMLSHKRIHTGKVFRCEFPECSYSTPRKSQFTAHVRSHTGDRSFICNICGRGFIDKNYLVKHKNIHLVDKPHKCRECDYSCSRGDRLREHCQKHHGDNPTAKVPYRPRNPRRQKYDPALFPGLISIPGQEIQEQSAPIELKTAVSTIVSASGNPVMYTIQSGTQELLQNHTIEEIQQLEEIQNTPQEYQIEQTLSIDGQSVITETVTMQNHIKAKINAQENATVTLTDLVSLM